MNRPKICGILKEEFTALSPFLVDCDVDVVTKMINRIADRIENDGYSEHGYRVKSRKTVFETDRKFFSNDQKICVGVWLESGCSFEDGEYDISISTGHTHISIQDTDLIKECLENHLESEYVPVDEVVEVYLESDGEMEGMHQFNKYFSIRKIEHVVVEEIPEKEQ